MREATCPQGHSEARTVLQLRALAPCYGGWSGDGILKSSREGFLSSVYLVAPHGQLGLWEQHVTQQHTAQVPIRSGISGMLQLLFTDTYCDPVMLELSA